MSTLSDDLPTLSREAALYLYPLVMMDVTRLQAINTPADAKPGHGPANEFHHMRAYPDAEFRAVVRPNFDTLYSSAWLDLTAGPVVVHAPDTADRYFMLPMLDMWTDVFANPGKRTTGTNAQDFVVTGPRYAGELPDGLPVITAPTPYVWIIGRTQTNGPADYRRSIRSRTATASPRWARRPSMSSTRAMTRRSSRCGSSTAWPRWTSSPTPPNCSRSTPARHRLLRAGPHHHLGIVVGKPFDATRLRTEQRTDIEAGWAAALHDMMTSRPRLGTNVKGWSITTTIGVYGNAYLPRATVAMVGLGANPAEDAIYPS